MDLVETVIQVDPLEEVTMDQDQEAERRISSSSTVAVTVEKSSAVILHYRSIFGRTRVSGLSSATYAGTGSRPKETSRSTSSDTPSVSHTLK